MENLIADANRGMRILKKRYETEKEYRDACVCLAEKCEKMIQFADTMLVNLDQTIKVCEAETVHVEYASGCKYLHRGYYSPSPVFHLFVIGPKRGKILRRMTSRCNPCFVYGFAPDKRLLWSKQLYNGAVLGMEYLAYQENCIYGITLDNNSNLQVITEEIMENGRIVSYTKYTIVTHDVDCEQYTYKGDVIDSCQWHSMHVPSGKSSFMDKMGVEILDCPIYRNDVFYFDNINGELKLKSN